MTTIAQIGCGYWGPNVLRAFLAQKDGRVKWLVDADPGRRAYVEKNFPSVKTTDDHRAVLADPEVDAALVVTPASTHAALAAEALAAGKHVFVEKPLAMSVAEVDKLTVLAAQKKKILMAGHTFLFNAAVRHVKKMIDADELGRLYYIYSQRLNLGQVRRDVNVWWNLAPHDVSILLYLMGGKTPATIAVSGVANVQPGVEDVAFAVLRWSDGMAAHIQASWLDPGKVRKMTFVGSRKMVVYDDVSDDRIMVYDKGVDRVPQTREKMDYDQPHGYQLLHRSGDVMLPHIDFEEPLKVEAAHFLHCIAKNETPLTGPAHARAVVAVLEAGDKSLKAGGAAVPVEGAS